MTFFILYLNKTALHFAVENNYLDICKILISNPKVNVNADYFENDTINFNTNKTALFTAVDNENIDIIKLLLTRNIKIDQYISEIDGKTAFHKAIERKNFEIFKLLLEYDKNIINVPVMLYDELDKAKKIPLIHTAVKYGNRQIVEYLLNMNKDWINEVLQYENDKHLLYSAIEGQNLETFQYLLELGVDPNDQVNRQDNLVKGALLASSPEILDILLKKGCKDPDFNGSMLSYTIDVYRYELIPVLIKNGDVVTAHDLQNACKHRLPIKVIRLLLDHISDQEFNSQANGYYAAHWMCQSMNYEIIEMFLKKGVDVNKLDKSGRSCLFSLRTLSHEKTVKILKLFDNVDFDINMVCKNEEGYQVASILGSIALSMTINYDLVEWLLKHGARTDVIVRGNMTIEEFVQRSRDQKLKDIFNRKYD